MNYATFAHKNQLENLQKISSKGENYLVPDEQNATEFALNWLTDKGYHLAVPMVKDKDLVIAIYK